MIMDKAIWLAVVLILVSFTNTQIEGPNSFRSFVQFHWGTCCNTHHVVSVDVSGSMFSWQSSVNTMLSSWRSYLQTQRARRNILVSAHQFNSNNLAWPNAPSPVIDKTPIDWNGPYSGASGGTIWSHGIDFLIDRLNAGEDDDICYTMITDQHPSLIYINPTTSSNFLRAYRNWRRYDCQICIRILDVRGLPRFAALQTRASNEELEKNAPTILQDMFKSAGINFTYQQLDNVGDMRKYYECCRRNPILDLCSGPRCGTPVP